MYFFHNKRRAARAVFIIGFFLMSIGITLFIGSIMHAPHVKVSIALSYAIAGIMCTVIAIKVHRRSVYIFITAFFSQVTLLLFFSALDIFLISIEKWWPVLAICSGIALMLTGWNQYGTLKYKYLVPSVIFIILGFLLLMFSLEIIPFSFSRFIQVWWPILIASAGLILFLVALSTRIRIKNT
ncbi:MAG: hypothetical protein LBQ77_03200 [Treponema sp.]|jgi:hypothetical protein|nr:hypothetical protein [Treponema sp.]